MFDFIETTLIEFLSSLDWWYICTLILITELLNKHCKKIILKPSFIVLIVGTILAFAYYFIMDGGLEYGRTLFRSMVATLAIHAWALKYVIKAVRKILMMEDEK